MHWVWTNISSIYYFTEIPIILKQHIQSDWITNERTDRRTDGRRDKVNPVYPPSNFVGRGYNKLSSIMLRLLDKLQLEQPEKFSFKWITQIKSILENTGFSEVWTADSIDNDLFKIAFKQRCNDIFKQTWLTDMMNNSQCTEYRKMKELHEFENYLIELEPSDRIALSKFRTRTHHLPVTHTRFQGPGAKATNCPLCPLSEVGDESHYLLRCIF